MGRSRDAWDGDILRRRQVGIYGEQGRRGYESAGTASAEAFRRASCSGVDHRSEEVPEGEVTRHDGLWTATSA